MKRKKKVIIVIHGLDNKPPSWLLRHWSVKAIREGLRNIGRGRFFFKVKLVYWADILHPEPLSYFVSDKKNSRYIDNPYVKGQRQVTCIEPKKTKMKIIDKVGSVLDKVFLGKSRVINLEKFTDALMKRIFRDIDDYYNSILATNHKRVRDEICGRLRSMLVKYADREILLVAHSMGTVISYDVLTRYDETRVDRLITIGSPLGLPFIINKIMNDPIKSSKKSVKRVSVITPENIVKSWHNMADPDDRIALVYKLSKKFKPNKRKIGPDDLLISNDYIFAGKRNPHNLFGYLRTPEIARLFDQLLSEK